MKHKYIIVNDSEANELETRKIMQCFSDFAHVESAFNFDDGLNAILRHKPELVFLEISPSNPSSNLSLHLISEVYRFLTIIPKFIIVTKSDAFALQAISYSVYDYLLWPLKIDDVRKTLLKIQKSQGADLLENYSDVADLSNSENLSCSYAEDSSDDVPASQNSSQMINNAMTICIKSYGDHRYIEASSILYLKADNNSTDIYTKNGEVITAFKTLKTFETTLPFPFVRVHNSFIVNSTHLSRIHIGNSLCYIKESSVKIPFSKSYKANVDLIISSLEGGNYFEF